MDFQTYGRERDSGSHQLLTWTGQQGLPVLCSTYKRLTQVYFSSAFFSYNIEIHEEKLRIDFNAAGTSWRTLLQSFMFREKRQI